ncbi:MAG: TlpA disulfide reductase family protein [Gordonia sp. (in: high G+C Gram-positive bacteria)]
MRLFACLGLVAVIVGVGACGTGDDAVVQGDTFQFVSPGGQTVITYAPADRAPVAPISGEDLVSGNPLSLTDSRFAGKAVVINVWGSWCAPCRAESPALEQIYEKYRDAGAAFLGINLRDNRQSAQDFIADRNVGYPSLYDFPGATLAALTTPTSVVPTTIVLDRAHRPAVVYLRAITADELGAAVQRVLDETPGGSDPVTSSPVTSSAATSSAATSSPATGTPR